MLVGRVRFELFYRRPGLAAGAAAINLVAGLGVSLFSGRDAISEEQMEFEEWKRFPRLYNLVDWEKMKATWTVKGTDAYYINPIPGVEYMVVSGAFDYKFKRPETKIGGDHVWNLFYRGTDPLLPRRDLTYIPADDVIGPGWKGVVFVFGSMGQENWSSKEKNLEAIIDAADTHFYETYHELWETKPFGPGFAGHEAVETYRSLSERVLDFLKNNPPTTEVITSAEFLSERLDADIKHMRIALNSLYSAKYIDRFQTVGKSKRPIHAYYVPGTVTGPLPKVKHSPLEDRLLAEISRRPMIPLFDADYESTQAGLANTLGVTPGQISRMTKKLLNEGRIVSATRSVVGERRKKLVYGLHHHPQAPEGRKKKDKSLFLEIRNEEVIRQWKEARALDTGPSWTRCEERMHRCGLCNQTFYLEDYPIEGGIVTEKCTAKASIDGAHYCVGCKHEFGPNSPPIPEGTPDPWDWGTVWDGRSKQKSLIPLGVHFVDDEDCFELHLCDSCNQEVFLEDVEDSVCPVEGAIDGAHHCKWCERYFGGDWGEGDLGEEPPPKDPWGWGTVWDARMPTGPSWPQCDQWQHRCQLCYKTYYSEDYDGGIVTEKCPAKASIDGAHLCMGCKHEFGPNSPPIPEEGYGPNPDYKPDPWSWGTVWDARRSLVQR